MDKVTFWTELGFYDVVLFFFSFAGLFVSWAVGKVFQENFWRASFKNQGKIAFLNAWTSLAYLFLPTFFANVFGFEKLPPLVEQKIYLQIPLITLSVATVFFYARKFILYYQIQYGHEPLDEKVGQFTRHLYLVQFGVALLGMPIFVTGWGPVRICISFMLCFLVCSLANLYFMGNHDSDRPLVIRDDSEPLFDLFTFRSVFSTNNPASHRSYFEALFPLLFIGSFSIVVISALVFNLSGNYVTNGKLVDLTWEEFMMISDSKTLGDMTKAEVLKNDEQTDQTPGAKVKLSAAVVKSRILDPEAANRKIASTTDKPLETVSLFIFRNCLSLAVLLLLMWAFQIRNLKTDYVSKWNKLNDRLYFIHEKSASLAADPATLLQLQFASDLVDTKMWGHRSFNAYFEATMARYLPHLKGVVDIATVKQGIREQIDQCLQGIEDKRGV